MKIILLIVGIGAIVALSWYLAFPNELPSLPARHVEALVRGTELRLEVADTPEKRAQGLSGREELAPNQGMVFVFKDPSFPVFSMRGINIPLDFIWLSEDHRVVDLHADVSPTYTGTLASRARVRYVIQVNSGWTRLHGVRIGDSVELPIINSR